MHTFGQRAPGAAAGVELWDVFCDGHHFQLDVFSLPIVMPYRIGERFGNRHFLCTVGSRFTEWPSIPRSTPGPHGGCRAGRFGCSTGR